MEKQKIYILLFIVLALVTASDVFFGDSAGGSILVPLIFWSGIAQGLIALLAAIELSEGRWAGALKEYLKDYHTILLIFPFIFLLISGHLDIYSWSEHPGGWLSEGFFIGRNFTALLLPYIFSFILVRSISKNSGKSKLFAGLYILSFVISQSFLAFDMVMTLEYPWINTLYGGYFFVESLYAGITFASVLAAFLYLKRRTEFSDILIDTTKMVMGFALLWVGLFFSQYLVIWYGNLPEEVAFIERRLDIHSLKYLGLYVIFSLFVIPFLSYISKKAKTSPPAVWFIAFIVLSGYLLEKVLLLLPTVKLNVLAVLVSTFICFIPFLFILRDQLKRDLD